jgi:hypothetical protein
MHDASAMALLNKWNMHWMRLCQCCGTRDDQWDHTECKARHPKECGRDHANTKMVILARANVLGRGLLRPKCGVDKVWI